MMMNNLEHVQEKKFKDKALTKALCVGKLYNRIKLKFQVPLQRIFNSMIWKENFV